MEIYKEVRFFMCRGYKSGIEKAVLVDEDIYEKYKHIKFHINDRGYARCWVRKNRIGLYGNPGKRAILLHKLVVGTTVGNIHHKKGKWDCRRENLRIYETHDEHISSEHRYIDPKERILRTADLHPHCG